MEDTEADQLYELSKLLYRDYPYDNLSDDFERDIDVSDDKGGNCVYLCRLFQEICASDNKVDAAKLRLYIYHERIHVA